MQKLNNMQRLIDSGVVAIVRTDCLNTAMKTAEAIRDGGITAIEITTTVPGVLEIISRLADSWRGEILIGAGTVLDGETARAAILAGAEFLVSPHLSLEVVRTCNRYQKISFPGAMSVREVVEAMEAGCDFVKFFPGSAFGPEMIRAIKAPLPQAPLVPTGGVSLDNVGDWIRAGCEMVCVGGELTRGARTGDYGLVTETARQLVAAVAAARQDR